MGLLTALYKSYNYGLENDLVGNLDDRENLILPLYHNSMKSNGKNIVEITLDKNSNLVNAGFLNEKDIVIFPVTEDSVARSSGIAPHPLFDNFDYVIQDGSKKSKAYLEIMEDWLNFEENDFVRIIHDFIIKENAYTDILSKLYDKYKIIKEDEKGKELKEKIITYIDNSGNKPKEIEVNFSKIFITFKIQDYDGLRDISITENKGLQNKFIDYTRKSFEKGTDLKRIICNISGKEDFLCLKHKPLIGSARLISQITANNENFKGRFDNPDETIKIGKESSQKILQMAKALLDGKNTCRWLGEMCYAVSWFSDDINNSSQMDIGKNIELESNNNFLFNYFSNAPRQTEANADESFKILDNKAKDIVRSFTSGKILFSDDSKYYMAIIDKVSNGRVAVKYFREIQSSRLKENLISWQKKYHWYKENKEKGEIEFTPNPLMMISAAYGVEREKGLEVSKKKFLTDQYKNIMAAIIEGRDLPTNISHALEMNIRNRMNYDKTWVQVKLCTLAVLKDKEGIKSNMLDRLDIDRSYLFGRLLALYERMEAISYDNDSARVTNAEKLWTSYVNKPVTMNMRLRNLLKPYEDKLKLNELKKGIYYKIKREIEDVTNLISENYNYKDIETNKPLGPGFIFGYEAQKKDLFTKKVNAENNNIESEEEYDK